MPGLVNTSISFDDQRRWETPWPVVRLLAEMVGIQRFHVDVCGSEENKKADIVYTEESSCLDRVSWAPSSRRRVPWWGWMNPPYNKPENACRVPCVKKTCIKRGYHLAGYLPGIGDFVARAAQEAAGGAMNVVGLLPANMDTAWFHEHILGVCPVVWVARGRIAFELDGVPNDQSTIANMACVWQAGVRRTRTELLPLELP